MELARERIWKELEKALMKANKPSIFFEMMKEMNQLSSWFPELEHLINVPQSLIHHPEGDVWNHTMLVVDEAAKVKSLTSNPQAFMLTALCHDFGKAVTTEEVNGKIHSLEHEIWGLPLIETFLDRVVNEVKIKKYVLNMVELHMKPNMMASQHSKKKKMNALFDISVNPDDLVLFAKVDHLGRLNPSDYNETEKFLKERLHWYKDVITKPEVMGRDLIELGLKPGPYFTELLVFAHKLLLANVNKESALKQVLAESKKYVNH